MSIVPLIVTARTVHRVRMDVSIIVTVRVAHRVRADASEIPTAIAASPDPARDPAVSSTVLPVLPLRPLT